MRTELIKPNEPSQLISRCSFSEQWVYVWMLPRFAFCYRERLDPTRLKHALAHVLSDYSAFAGRLAYRQGGWHVEHGRGCAAFELAHSTRQSEELGAAARAKSTDIVCPRLSVWRAMRGKGPLLAVRLTQTPDGSVLGVTWNHLVGDVHSAMLLLRALARAYGDLPYDKPVELEDVDAFLSEHLPRPSDNGRRRRLVPWLPYLRMVVYLMVMPWLRLTQEFSALDLAAIQAAASRLTRVSVHIALCAHVFATLRRLRGRRASSLLAVVVNYRTRLGLPANLLGNMLDLAGTTVTETDDTPSIAKRLRERVDDFARGPIAHHEMMQYQASRMGPLKLMRLVDDFFDPLRGNLILTTAARSGMSELVFGASKPVFVCARGSEKGGAFWHGAVLDNANNAGLVLEMFLPLRLGRRMKRELMRPCAAVIRDNEDSVHATQAVLMHSA